MKRNDPMPSPNDPPRPACANCRWNVKDVCTYVGHGNNPYPDNWPGRPITWDAKITHCGQHIYRNQNHTNR